MHKSVPINFQAVTFSNMACGYPAFRQIDGKNYFRVSMQSLSSFKFTTELILENTPIEVDDICRDGSMFVGMAGSNQTVEIYKINSRSSFTKVCSYTPGKPSWDAKFCLVDGREMVLMLVAADNAVHIVDHMDGGRFVRCLDTGTVKLSQPFMLCTDYDKHVWVGCNGGKVVMVDL
jgi:hypothetical protein